LGESKNIFTWHHVIHLSPPQFQLQEKKIHVCQCIARILVFSIKSPSVSPLSPLLSPPYPLCQWYPQSKEILLNLSMKCWNSAFNAQGSKVIIVVV
jgi:hypothetical protein